MSRSTADSVAEDLGHVVVIIPTYDERDNIVAITTRLRTAVPQAHLLIVDDGSPDGTGALADGLARADDHVHVLHRSSKAGLGAAYVAGFGWALMHGFDVVVEMDADGSHAPEQLPRLLAALGGADLVLGSRWVPGGQVENWPMGRRLLSRGGNTYARLALGIPLRDSTGGFRAYRRHVLEEIKVAAVSSQGYCFQVDLARRAWRQGFRVVEVPITFRERERGTSKMSNKIVVEALWRITGWGLRSRRRLAVNPKSVAAREHPNPSGQHARTT